MAGPALLPGPAELAVFAAAVALLNATPGVDFLLTVSRTLQAGARAGLAAAAGISAGCVVHALAAAFGLATLLALHPAAFVAIQWVGAAYLVVLGLQMLARAGLLTNVQPPKVALFFLAFLPQFVPAESPAVTVSFLLLGSWFVLQGGLFLALLVLLAARLSRLVGAGTPGLLKRLLQAAGGLLFIALALRILKERPVMA
jgi:threonine/homoserine/homoserine lactone efflux protein